METKFQTSFIPKKPVVVTQGTPRVKEPRSFIASISVIVFFLAFFAAVGLFGYNIFVTKQNDVMKTSLQEKIKIFDNNLTEDLTDLNTRISSSEELLSKHIAPSLFFDLLESLALRNVQFNDLTFTAVPGGDMHASLKGRARSYNALVSQADQFSKNTNLLNPFFSNFSLDDSGNVLFSAEVDIAPQLVSYSSIVKEVKSSTPQVSVSTSTSDILPTGTSTKTN